MLTLKQQIVNEIVDKHINSMCREITKLDNEVLKPIINHKKYLDIDIVQQQLTKSLCDYYGVN